MLGRGNCPGWCTDHVTGPSGGQHRTVIGEVRITVIGGGSGRRVIYAIRRRAGRTPAEMADLEADLSAVDGLLHGQRGGEHRYRADDRHGWALGALAAV